MSRMVHKQDVVTTRGVPSRLSEEGSATVMVRVRGLKWFGGNAASVLRLATPCQRVGGDLVCVCYPCMSYSGKGVQCSARGCIKYVHHTKGENENFIVSFIVLTWHSKDASIQDVSMMHCREVCVGAMVQTPNFAVMTLSCSMSPQKSG